MSFCRSTILFPVVSFTFGLPRWRYWLRRGMCCLATVTSLGPRPRLAGSSCQVIAAYALRLNSRAGTEGSTMSSLNCVRWLILGLEALSH